MTYSFAPLEGITGYIFRAAHHEVFPEVDEYWIPFASPVMGQTLTPKELRNLAPENNLGIRAVPQLLVNRPEPFLQAAHEIYDLGYREINLNTGCPSPTVVTKYKGSGMLRDPAALDAFFNELFKRWDLDMPITVKTRLGIADEAEFDTILDIFNSYPIAGIVLHPRVQKDGYKYPVRPDAFRRAAQRCRHPLTYNGDLHTVTDCRRIETEYPQLNGLMLGRGLLENPGLITTLKTGRTATKEEIYRFHHLYYTRLALTMSGDIHCLSKMKELWVFLSRSFPGSEKHLKQIKKCSRRSDYESIVEGLFRDLDFIPM